MQASGAIVSSRSSCVKNRSRIPARTPLLRPAAAALYAIGVLVLRPRPCAPSWLPTPTACGTPPGVRSGSGARAPSVGSASDPLLRDARRRSSPAPRPRDGEGLRGPRARAVRQRRRGRSRDADSGRSVAASIVSTNFLRLGVNRIAIEASSPYGNRRHPVFAWIWTPMGATPSSRTRLWRVDFSDGAVTAGGRYRPTVWGRPPQYPWGYPQAAETGGSAQFSVVSFQCQELRS